jgi:hypothetical protein
LKKGESEGVLLTPLHILQMRRAFIAALTSEKSMDDNQKKFIPQLPVDTKFFHSAFLNPCMM